MASSQLGFSLANTSMQEEEILHIATSHTMITEDFSTSNTEKDLSPLKNYILEMISYKNIVTRESFVKLGPNEEEKIDMQKDEDNANDIRVKENWI